MLASSIPVKFPQPFAASAGGSYIRPIPNASQIGIQNGAASLADGFPPLTFVDVAAGGAFPFGQDTNGILNQISAWSQWQNAGAPVTHDATFSTAIGGYPAGALLYSDAGNSWWLSLVDNNTSDPDTGGANWQGVSYGHLYAGNPNTHVAGVAPIDGFITQSLLWDTTNLILWICTTTGNAAGAVWTQLTGGSGSGGVWCGTSTGTANVQAVATPATLQAFPAGTSIRWLVGAGLTNTNAMTLMVGSFGTFAIRKDGLAGPAALVGGEGVAGNILTGTFDGTYIQLTAPALGTAAQANASSATGKVAAVLGTITAGHIAMFSDTSGTVQDGGSIAAAASYTYINNSATVGPGVYLVDTSAGPITLTLIVSPTAGQNYLFADSKGTFDTHNLTVDGNGHNFITPFGVTFGLLTEDVRGHEILTWFDGTNWRLV